MGKGKRYELDTKNEVMANTTDEVIALRPDYSGNSLHSISDVSIIWPDYADSIIHGAFIEMKKRSGEAGYRTTVMDGSSKGESGLEELQHLVENTPPWGTPWIVVKFDNREVAVFNAEELLKKVEAMSEDTDNPAFFGARLTPAGSISMVKPTLDDWNSSTAGRDDHIKILDTVGVHNFYLDEGEDIDFSPMLGSSA